MDRFYSQLIAILFISYLISIGMLIEWIGQGIKSHTIWQIALGVISLIIYLYIGNRIRAFVIKWRAKME